MVYSSAAQGSANAMKHLGAAYQFGKEDLEPCSYRELYWYQKAAELANAKAYVNLSVALMNVHERRSDDFDGYCFHTGFTIIPQSLYWARKALESGEDERAPNLVERLERLCRFDTCAECKKTSKDLGRLLSQCSRCQVRHYLLV